MWDGPGPRQRGGAPFRGNQRGEMFGGRDNTMSNFRGRDDMNMGSMGLMGPRPLDLPPMDMRRMDGPPMRSHNMEPCDMRAREANRDAMRWGEKPDFSLRKQFESSIREKLINSTGFMGTNRNSPDMDGRGNAPWDQHNKFNDIRERNSFHPNMPQFNNPNGNGGRGFPPDRMNHSHDGFRDGHKSHPMGSGEGDRFNMSFPSHERRRMDFDRRGGPPFDSRGEFDSDMDFRNRPEPSADFRARDRSPLRFGGCSIGSADLRGPDMSLPGPQRLGFTTAGDSPRDGPCQESGGSPLMDYRCGEEMTLAEEWKNRQKDKTPFVNVAKGIGEICEPSFPVGFDRDVNVRDSLSFQERGRPSGDFPKNEMNFPHDGHIPVNNSRQIGGNGPQQNQPLERGCFTAPFGRNDESKHWLEERHPKHNQNKSRERSKEPKEGFEGLEGGQCTTGGKLGLEHDFQSSNTVQVKDQDYRDIDYRTGSVRAFDYKRDELPPTEKLIPESKPVPPSKFSESGCQDQDYRSASVEDKVSNTISIIGIPKTATMEQILGAFVVRDGVPLQGMKVKNVVPGYSYDTAYVEFLILEDAVHFMESNKGSLKVGTRTASMKFVQPDNHETVHELVPNPQEPHLPPPDVSTENFNSNLKETPPRGPVDPLPTDLWPRNSDLTPEAWQQQVDQQQQLQDREQQGESWGGATHPPQSPLQSGSVFKDSKTMIIKNVKASTSVETILKALDPYAYLDERNVRLVKGKTPGAKCFCFVDMDSHEQVTRLVELLTKPRPLYIDGVRVYAEVAKPLKNQNLRRDFDKPYSSILGCPPEPAMVGLNQYSQPQQYSLPLSAPPVAPVAPVAPALTPGHLIGATNLSSDVGANQAHGYAESQNMDQSFHTSGSQAPTDSTSMAATGDESQTYSSGSEVPDLSSYLYDSTSGFYYDPETTLYYDPNSRYFYNAQTQDYLYWDPVSKTYVPVPSGSSAETPSVTMTAEDRAILSNPAADAPLEMRKTSALSPNETAPAHLAAPVATSISATTPEKKEDEESVKKDKEEKPKSLAAVKIMKDMERWAKIQNRQKESVRAPSPVLKTGTDDEKRQSKSADAAFAIFERKVSGGDDLFKKPMAPPKKDEKSKRPMGSLGMLVSDYGAGSDEEVEEDREEDVKSNQNSQGFQPKDKEDKLTDWKKMACLLCRRQFPNKDALIRHQQLSDLHKQNMEIHLKIKRSKKELEALENQEREVKKTFKMNAKETRSPEQKRKKHHQNQQHWAETSREGRGVSERPGLGAEPVQKKRKEPVVWDSGAYKQLCRKAMYARFKELE